MNPAKPNNYDVCIVGGGLAGLTLAALLCELDLSIAIVERMPLPIASEAPNLDAFALRVSAINLASMRIFEHLGIQPALLEARASAYHSMQIWDANSDAKIQFDADEIDAEQLGYVIENNNIINALWRILKVNKNVVFYADNLVSIELLGEGVGIDLNENTLQAQLLIGADGQFSKVRALAKIPTETGSFNQSALVCRIQTERPHQQTAYQCFQHSGPIAYLPLLDGSSSIVWSCDTVKARHLQQLDDEDFASEIQQAMQSILGDIQILGPRGAFPLAQQHASRYIESRIALIGDAAHRTHPLAGLGANLGLQDAAALGEVIQNALQQNRPFYSTTSLRKYERWRKHQNALILDTMQAFKSGFASHSPGLTSLRELALNSANQFQPLKTLITQLATGNRGDLPQVCKPAIR